MLEMSIPKTVFFVDGENLVFRYQAMLAEGRKPTHGVIHIPNVFVWHQDITRSSIMNVVRVNYYTSMVGDDLAIDDMKRHIGTITYEYEYAYAPFSKTQHTPTGSAEIFRMFLRS
jgi:hypothetical protein